MVKIIKYNYSTVPIINYNYSIVPINYNYIISIINYNYSIVPNIFTVWYQSSTIIAVYETGARCA